VPDESVDAFTIGLERVRELTFDGAAIRTHALRFSRDRFLREFTDVVDRTLARRPAC
jgi:hypothetical protein